MDQNEDCSFWVRLQTAWIVFRVVAGLVPLRAALFCSCGSGKWQIRPLPSRLALRQLWTCMRISFLLMAYDRVLYSYAFMKVADNPYTSTVGVPALTEGIIIAVFAILMTAGVRRSETLPDLIPFATHTRLSSPGAPAYPSSLCRLRRSLAQLLFRCRHYDNDRR